MAPSSRNMGPFMLTNKRPGVQTETPPTGRRQVLFSFPIARRMLTAGTTATVDNSRNGVLPWRFRG